MLFETERPTKLSEIVGRDKEITQIKAMIEKPDGIPHIILSGKQGTGKTATANVIATEVLGDVKKSNFFEFNASSTRGIDFIRNEISEIAKRRPMGGAPKIILLDEADNITRCSDVYASNNGINHKFTIHTYCKLPIQTDYVAFSLCINSI